MAAVIGACGSPGTECADPSGLVGHTDMYLVAGDAVRCPAELTGPTPAPLGGDWVGCYGGAQVTSDGCAVSVSRTCAMIGPDGSPSGELTQRGWATQTQLAPVAYTGKTDITFRMPLERVHCDYAWSWVER